MSKAMVRICFAGAFAVIGLLGALALELTGTSVPPWLAGLVGAAGGYLFGHVQENGVNGKKARQG